MSSLFARNVTHFDGQYLESKRILQDDKGQTRTRLEDNGEISFSKHKGIQPSVKISIMSSTRRQKGIRNPPLMRQKDAKLSPLTKLFIATWMIFVGGKHKISDLKEHIKDHLRKYLRESK